MCSYPTKIGVVYNSFPGPTQVSITWLGMRLGYCAFKNRAEPNKASLGFRSLHSDIIRHPEEEVTSDITQAIFWLFV